MVQLVRLSDGLQQGFDTLMTLATAEGHRNMARLANELATGSTAFIALLAAMSEGTVIGIGGMTLEPESANETAVRLRRLYVAPSVRRTGVAQSLVSALLQEASDQVDLVTVHAGSAEAGRFWEAQGFSTVDDAPWTHQTRRSG